MLSLRLVLTLSLFVSCLSNVYFTPCSESTSRLCPFGTNSTAYLIRLKRGGTSAATINSYDPSYFLCEEYNYNCGYLEQQDDYLTVAEGMQLGINSAQLSAIVPNNSALRTKVQPYLMTQGSRAQCLSNLFPLTLTDAQSNQLMNDYLVRLSANLSVLYNAQKSSSALAWSSLSYNTITAILQLHKLALYSTPTFVSGPYWTYFITNQWSTLASELQATSRLEYIHSSYLIGLMATAYNKQQSVNFLIDESLPIGSTNFAYIKQFITDYMSTSKDDPSLMSLSFYGATTQRIISQSSTNSQVNLLAAAIGHSCSCSSSPYLGQALNATTNHILSRSIPKATPKVIVVITGSTSLDDVILASNYARSNNITPIVIAVGGSYNRAQAVSIATEDNLIQMSTFSLMANLNTAIQAFLVKQFIDVNPGQTVPNNVVRETSSPNYYRIPRSSDATTYHKVTVTHKNDPQLHGYLALTSPYDPFPDTISHRQVQHYRVSIYVYEYYLSPSANHEIPLKKDITYNYTSHYYFFSISGNNLSYDIQVTACPDKNCTQDRAEAQAISSQNHDVNLQQDAGASNVDNITVFAGIGTGLAALGLGTYAVINGLRKISESVQEPGLEGEGSGHDLGGEGEGEGEVVRENNEWNNSNYEDQEQVQQNKQKKGSVKSQSNKSNSQNKTQKSQKSNKSKKSKQSKESEKSKKDSKNSQSGSNKSNQSAVSNKSQKEEEAKASNKSAGSVKQQGSNKAEAEEHPAEVEEERPVVEQQNVLDGQAEAQLPYNENW